MTLSDPAARQLMHERSVTCCGYRRRDGLWDIEGHLRDSKDYTFTNEYRGSIAPGDPIHEMRLRLTLDDRFKVHAVEAVTEKGPFAQCAAITPAFQTLVGLTIGPGWHRAVKQRLGGVRGCTHLVELLGPIATTAFQTIYPILVRERAAETKAPPKDQADGADSDPPPRPALLDTCHIFASDGAFAGRNWPDHYTGPETTPALDEGAATAQSTEGEGRPQGLPQEPSQG